MATIKPFTKSYVMRKATSSAKRHVDLSIRMTFARIQDFPNDPEKSKEIFETLALLHTLRNSIDEFQNLNSEHYKG